MKRSLEIAFVIFSASTLALAHGTYGKIPSASSAPSGAGGTFSGGVIRGKPAPSNLSGDEFFKGVGADSSAEPSTFIPKTGKMRDSLYGPAIRW